ncbi:MAG: DUF1559 domain-containing protein [Planctomycetaceae bacterium]
MSPHRLKVRGFTLVELVAVTASVSLVMSLAFPAMQRAREDARGQACKNNLKQLALTLHNYHDVHRTFPPGWVVKGTEPKAGPAFSWSAMILPYLDQARLYNELPISGPPTFEKPSLYTTDLQVFRCPADESPSKLKDRGGFGTSNYVGNYGDELIPEEGDAEPASGFFFRNSKIGMRDVRDGTSNTIMAGERGSDTGAAIWSIVRSNGQAEDAVASSNDEKKINTVADSYSSAHEGGVYFVFADGAVRFISEKIGSSKELDGPKGTFQKLAHRDDGIVIGDDELNP